MLCTAAALLNEVLSLNAQEYEGTRLQGHRARPQ